MDDTQKAVYQGRLASIKEADSKADLRDELYWPLNSNRFGWESSAIDVWIEDSFWELLDLPEHIEALREVLTNVCREACCYSMHTVYIDGDVIGETEGYDDSELTRSYLCEQIQELVRLSIKYSGLV